MPSEPEIDFRRLRIVTALPHGAAAETLIRCLQRLGGSLEHHWPPPASLEGKTDIAVYLICEETREFSRVLAEDGCALVGVLDPGDPRAMQLAAQTNPHAVLTRPFDPAIVLTSLVVARNNSLYQRRLLNKIAKLEETLRSIRKVERAKTILMRQRGLDESQAYAHLRGQAMKKRVPIGAVAGAVIESEEFLSADDNSTRPRQG